MAQSAYLMTSGRLLGGIPQGTLIGGIWAHGIDGALMFGIELGYGNRSIPVANGLAKMLA